MLAQVSGFQQAAGQPGLADTNIGGARPARRPGKLEPTLQAVTRTLDAGHVFVPNRAAAPTKKNLALAKVTPDLPYIYIACVRAKSLCYPAIITYSIRASRILSV